MENQIEKDLTIVNSIEVLNEMEKAAIDVQISTAKHYPRNIRNAVNNSIATVTMNEKTAETCGYTLRFRGSEIKGKSVYLARILAQYWGNLRCESGILGASATHVKSYAIAFDLESNYALCRIVEKPIIKKDGSRYSPDMIATAGAAAAAIAFRNAVLEVIPQSISDEIYQAAERKILGKLTNEDELKKKRKIMIDGFKDQFNIPIESILKRFNVRSESQLDATKIKELIDLANAIKEGITSIEDEFDIKVEDGIKNKELKDDLEMKNPE